MSPNDPLLSPFQLKNLTLKNRVVSTSHAPAYAEGGLPGERYLRYHEAKAKGGLALTMMGGASCVAPDSPAFVSNIALYHDDIVPHLRRISDAVHEHGALIMTQMSHAGRRTSNYDGEWLPVISASGVRETQHRSVPKEAEDWDIDRIVTAYADSAERCVAGGLDGIELFASGHLMDQFWSPLTNHRSDGYGGDLDGRIRFASEVVRAIRTRVGDEFVVGLRMAVDEGIPGGLQADEGVEIIRRLTADGIDFLSLLRGSHDNDARLSKIIPPMGTPANPNLDFAGEIRKQVDIPVMHAGRIADLATARYAVSEGILDLVGMTRAQIADPNMMRKMIAGEEDRIRPCVGAGYCIDRVYSAQESLCIHNPATGREFELPQEVSPAETRKKAVVVGAGPSGLEAARVLAERGHDVVVFEVMDRPGGQIVLAAQPEMRRDLTGIVDWRVEECRLLGVDLRFDVYAEAAEVLAENPDVVVVATGGLANASLVGVPDDLLTESWQIISREVTPGREVLVVDEGGDHQGPAAAVAAAESGSSVEYVTAERTLLPLVGTTNYPGYLAAFRRNNVQRALGTRVTGVSRTTDRRLEVVLTDEFTGDTETRTVDQVVVENGTVPNADVYFELKEQSRNRGAVDHSELLALREQTVEHNPDGTFRLYRIGDAVSSRNIHAAILDAYRLCLAI